MTVIDAAPVDLDEDDDLLHPDLIVQHYNSMGEWCPWSGNRTATGECPEGHFIPWTVSR